MISTIQEYRAALDQIYNLSITLESQAKIEALQRAVEEFETNSPRYYIVCIKACYVGQGIDFAPGEVVDSSYDYEHIAAKLKRVNKDPWALDCFALAFQDHK